MSRRRVARDAAAAAAVVLVVAGASPAQLAPAQSAPPPGAEATDRESAYERAGGSLARAQAKMEDAPADANPFAVRPPDPKRIKKHDLVTVIVNEQSASQTKDTTDLKRTADINALLSNYIKLNSQLQLKGTTPANPPNLSFTTDRNFKGDGSVERSDTMSARVQAEVVDVRPNGTLVLQAVKHIKNDDEEQSFTLTGFIRAEDVTPDNSVLSSQLAELTLEKTTKGAAHDTSSRGLVQRFFDWINPF